MTTKTKYYLYAGYYELLLTNHELKAPFMYQASSTSLNKLINKNLSDTDEQGEWSNPNALFNIDDAHMIFDKNITKELDNTDMFSGLISRMENTEDKEEMELNGIHDLSKYYVADNLEL